MIATAAAGGGEDADKKHDEPSVENDDIDWCGGEGDGAAAAAAAAPADRRPVNRYGSSEYIRPQCCPVGAANYGSHARSDKLDQRSSQPAAANQEQSSLLGNPRRSNFIQAKFTARLLSFFHTTIPFAKF